jgi:predicted nucleic acid-binding protein
MIVVADTTPLNYLILIDLTHILSELFGQVIVPQAVLSESQSPHAPDKVREWFAHRTQPTPMVRKPPSLLWRDARGDIR